ncbi:MAG: peptide ABC transporter substrate-binding protein, partial [Thermodesulfobacteriota bacterium]
PLLYPIKNAEKAKRGAVPSDQIGIRSLDERTLQIELEAPTPYFLDLISFCVFYPVPRTVDATDPHWMERAGPQFVCNGPFKLATWKHHDEIVLEKNPLYWEAPQIDLDTIKISMVSDENTALNMFENNEIDLMGLGISPIPNDVLLQYHRRGLLKTKPFPATSIVCFNVAKFPFNNKNIRKAFACAINRKEIVDNITQLGEETATNVISPSLRDNRTICYFKDHDVKEAQRFFRLGLEELGIARSAFPHLTFYYSQNDLNHRLAQTLQQQWTDALGIKIQLEHSEHKIFLDRLRSRNYEIAQSFWAAQYNDPMNILERFKYKANMKNYPGWENTDYIRLLEKTAFDTSPEERMKTMEAAEALMMEEMPLAPLYHWKTSFIIKDHLKYQEYKDSGVVELTRISFKDAPSNS